MMTPSADPYPSTLMRCSLIAACLLISSTVTAQRIPDPVDNRREIHIHDGRPVLKRFTSLETLDGEADTKAQRSWNRKRLLDVAAFATAFLEPPLGDPEDLQVLGSNLFVLRSRPKQQVAFQQLLSHLSRSEHSAASVECRLVRVTRVAFQKTIAPLLGRAEEVPRKVVLDADDVDGFERALQKNRAVDLFRKVRLTLLPATAGKALVQNPITYFRKDYEVELRNGKAKVWPITGKLKDGLSVELRCASLAKNVAGVSIRAALSKVERPIPTFKTSLAGSNDKLVLDLPRVTICSFAGDLRLSSGALGILVGDESGSGERLLVLVKVRLD